MTAYTDHKERWSDCTECFLHKTRCKVVLLRGTVPAPILFIGEAPGVSEDVLGVPFIGPAGKLLDQIINSAGIKKFALTNLVCCIPKDEQGEKSGEPERRSIIACRIRLRECFRMCRPELLVNVGGVAKSWVPRMLETGDSVTTLDIVHPASILRLGAMQQGLAIQRCVVALEDAADDLKGEQ